MAYFKRVTSEAAPGRQNAVVMGRKTYESIPSKFGRSRTASMWCSRALTQFMGKRV